MADEHEELMAELVEQGLDEEVAADVLETLGGLREELEVPPEALRETGNGPDLSYEEAALEALFGPADENGVYGAVSEDES
jgi:hypothetical protein